VGRYDNDREDEFAAAPKFLREEWDSFINPQISNDESLESDLDAAEASIASRTVAGQLQQAFDEELRLERVARWEKVKAEREAERAADLLEERTWRDLSRRHSVPYNEQLTTLFELKGHEAERARWKLTPRRWAQLREDYDRECED